MGGPKTGEISSVGTTAKKSVGIPELLESHQRLVKHLVKRGLFPDADLEYVLEPLGIKLKAGNPGIWMFDKEADENA